MKAVQSSCCPESAEGKSPCTCRVEESSLPQEIRTTTSEITASNRFDHVLARWGWRREAHIVKPGLYQLGNPTPDSMVFASANYTLSFDALRSALHDTDAWILVLDTKGINVWCAAGKGTFGTDELVRMIEYSNLAGIVRHRKIIVPQLGAPGISWPEVIRRSGFLVEYGPVRARDLPLYLKNHAATPEMRRVEFPLRDRLILIPIEMIAILLPMLVISILLYFISGPFIALAAVSAVLAGTVLFTALLPFIPTRDFSSKGFILGFIVAIPFAYLFSHNPDLPGWAALLAGFTPLLLMPAVTAYLALNFTGSTTYTSRTGVKKEIFRYVPFMVILSVLGVVTGILLGASRLAGVI